MTRLDQCILHMTRLCGRECDVKLDRVRRAPQHVARAFPDHRYAHLRMRRVDPCQGHRPVGRENTNGRSDLVCNMPPDTSPYALLGLAWGRSAERQPSRKTAAASGEVMTAQSKPPDRSAPGRASRSGPGAVSTSGSSIAGTPRAASIASSFAFLPASRVSTTRARSLRPARLLDALHVSVFGKDAAG